MADRYDDARMDHFRALPGSRRPYRARHRHACPRPLAMEHGRILRLVKWTSGLWVGAGRKGRVETVPTPFQVPFEEWTQRFMVNKRQSRGRKVGIDRFRLIRVESFYARPTA